MSRFNQSLAVAGVVAVLFIYRMAIGRRQGSGVFHSGHSTSLEG